MVGHPSELNDVPGLPRIEDSYYKDNSHESPLLHRVETFAMEKIGSLSTDYAYHCLEHTAMVVRNARAIGAALKLGDKEFQLLIASSWLHDVGFTVTYRGHEEEGCHMAEALLKDEMGKDDLSLIKEAIMSTEIPQKADDPSSGAHRVAKVLCDADLLYLGTNIFFPWSDRLRDEHRDVLAMTYTDEDWIDVNVGFIRDHQFFTEFARDYCAAGCAHNLRTLVEMRGG